jgi:hypothetical protein
MLPFSFPPASVLQEGLRTAVTCQTIQGDLPIQFQWTRQVVLQATFCVFTVNALGAFNQLYIRSVLCKKKSVEFKTILKLLKELETRLGLAKTGRLDRSWLGEGQDCQLFVFSNRLSLTVLYIELVSF